MDDIEHYMQFYGYFHNTVEQAFNLLGGRSTEFSTVTKQYPNRNGGTKAPHRSRSTENERTAGRRRSDRMTERRIWSDSSH